MKPVIPVTCLICEAVVGYTQSEDQWLTRCEQADKKTDCENYKSAFDL